MMNDFSIKNHITNFFEKIFWKYDDDDDDDDNDELLLWYDWATKGV